MKRKIRELKNTGCFFRNSLPEKMIRLLLSLLVLSYSTCVAEPAFAKLDWFKLSPEAGAFWKMTLDPHDSLKFTLKPGETGPAAGKKAHAYNIFVIFPKKSSAYDTALATVLNVFKHKGVAAHMTVINFLGKPKLGEKALQLAESENANLILSMGSGSTAFIHKNYSGKRIPVVSICSKDPVLMGQMEGYYAGSGTNIAYTSLNVPVELQMAYLKDFMPNLKNIIVMYAADNKSAVITQFIPLKNVAEKQGMKIFEVAVLDQKNARHEIETQMPSVIKSLGDDPGVKRNSLIWITGSTSIFREIAAINRLSASIPVLSVVPDVVTKGDDSALLSIGVSFESNAYMASVYAVNILRKKVNPGQLKVGIVSPPDIAINFKKARQGNIKIPFSFFELASYIYDHEGRPVRKEGRNIKH